MTGFPKLALRVSASHEGEQVSEWVSLVFPPVTGHGSPMDRKRVSASNIRAVGCDAGRQILEVEFTSGSVVQYSGVSPVVHRRFMIGGQLR